ncbi:MULTISPECIES: hypothetical protein [unclassified Janthinobacterium]|nr:MULTISPECIES: hypothetical protein [unclassified Janthinobacterium]MEC5163009.1 hypothetical protein [Janthinobacterium sp. CG_S6]
MMFDDIAKAGRYLGQSARLMVGLPALSKTRDIETRPRRCCAALACAHS